MKWNVIENHIFSLDKMLTNPIVIYITLYITTG